MRCVSILITKIIVCNNNVTIFFKEMFFFIRIGFISISDAHVLSLKIDTTITAKPAGIYNFIPL